MVVKEGIEVKKIRMQNVHGSEGSINNEEKEIQLMLLAKLLVVYMIQYITELRSVLIKNQAHITTVKLPFVSKRHVNVLQKNEC